MAKKETAAQELARLRKENEELKEKAAKKTGLKVSQKGAVSLYGMRRFPITFYKSEWLEILNKADEIKAFIKKHDSELADGKE